MTRPVILVGFALLAVAAVGLEVAARRTGRLATFGQAVAALVRPAAGRVVALGAWLWLGWHLFVRVHRR